MGLGGMMGLGGASLTRMGGFVGEVGSAGVGGGLVCDMCYRWWVLLGVFGEQGEIK